MRRRLAAAAGAIEVGNGVGTKDAETVGAARRDIDAAVGRRRRGEENMLPFDKRTMGRLELRELLGHALLHSHRLAGNADPAWRIAPELRQRKSLPQRYPVC